MKPTAGVKNKLPTTWITTITPVSVNKTKEQIMQQSAVANNRNDGGSKAYIEKEEIDVAADPVVQYMNKDELKKTISRTKKNMETAAKELDFIEAARLRDEMYALEKLLNSK